MLKNPALDAFMEKPRYLRSEASECAFVSFTGRGVNS
jgi:hypothetical protein